MCRVTKFTFFNFSVKDFLICKNTSWFFESLPYLWGVTAGQLRRHLTSMSDIQKLTIVVIMVKKGEHNGVEDIGLVTTNPAPINQKFWCSVVLKDTIAQWTFTLTV